MRQEFLTNSASVFEGETTQKKEEAIDTEVLYSKIGKLEMERDRPATRFLKKSLKKTGLYP